MPGVTREGKVAQSYGYDVGGKTQKSNGVERGEKMPASGSVGRLDKENTDMSYTRPGNNDGPAASYAKTGYESTAFDKHGNVKSAVKSDVSFIEKDGSWAPAQGRGGK